jgi:hypothetical protein
MKKSIFYGARKFRIAAGIFCLALFTSSGCIACDCDGGISNTGADCSKVFRDTIGLDFMPMTANDGTENGIDVTGATTINKTLFDDMINNTDPSKRLYPIASDNGLKDVEQVRAAIVTRTFTDGDDEFIRQGTKSFKGWITGRYATPQYAAKLESIRCADMGVYKTDRGYNYIGAISADGSKLVPIRVTAGSFYATYMEATPDKNNAYIEIGFNFSPSELDGRLRMIACSEFVNYKPNMNRGLVDVCGLVSEITDSSFVIQLQTDQGTPLNPLTVKNLAQADFSLHNDTTNADVPITSFDEDPAGTYAIGFAAQNDGDELTLTIAHNGYDFTCVSDTPIVTPMS